MYIYVYKYTSVCRYMMTMHVCLYVGVYIYIYIHTHTHNMYIYICMICRYKTRLPNCLAFTEQGWSSKYVNTGQTNGKLLMFVLVSLTCWSWTFWVHQQPKLVGQELILTYIQSKVAAFFSLQFKLIFRLRSSGSVFQNHDQSATTYPYILEIVEYDIKRTQNTEDDPNIETVGYVVYSSTNWRTQRKKRTIFGNCVLV